MKLALKTPITLKDTSGGPDVIVSDLNLRETLCAGDLRGIKLATLSELLTDDVIKVASRLSGQPEAVLAKLGPVDLMEVATVIGGFLMAGQDSSTR